MTESPSPPTPSADPPDASTEAAVRRTLRLSVVEGGLTQTFLNWTSGSVLIGYMLHLGASPTDLGLVASVPLLAQTVSPLAALLAGMFGRRRLLTVLAAALGRALWLLAALLPALGVPDAFRPTFLIVLVLVSSVFQAAAGTLWAAWIGDVVPEERRGRYFGFRTGVVGVVGMTASLAAGWFLDRVAAPLNFQLVIAVAVVSGAAGVALYLRHYDPPAVGARPVTPTLGAILTGPLRDTNFRAFLRFAVYWQFAVLLAAPFVFPYFLGELRMSFTQVAIWSAIAAISALFTTVLWGRGADRYGNKVVLAIGTFVAGLALPACWILAGLTGNLGFIWVSAVFDAVAWGAIGPAIFNLALVSAPRADRLAFIAMYSLASGLAGFLGGLLSGPLLDLLRPLEFGLFGAKWTAFHSLFVVSGLARSQAWRLLRPIREAEAWRTRDVLRTIRFGWRGIGFPWR